MQVEFRDGFMVIPSHLISLIRPESYIRSEQGFFNKLDRHIGQAKLTEEQKKELGAIAYYNKILRRELTKRQNN